MPAVLTISNLSKTYATGFSALKTINLDIQKGEIFALLGPNGAGKTTLISIVCGLTSATSGQVTVGGFDIVRDYRKARGLIGLVPQELKTDTFETVWATVNLSRGLFGKPRDPARVEKVLRDLSLWDKKDSKIITLSGGMKQKAALAGALVHDPKLLILDEPTAGVDVELRRDMWNMVRKLREDGVTVILTTHYIEEAEEMADRVGVIAKGELILVDEKTALMSKMGKKQLTLQLQAPLNTLPEGLAGFPLELNANGSELVYTYDAKQEHLGIADLMKRMEDLGIGFKDLQTKQSSLEDIFISLVEEPA